MEEPLLQEFLLDNLKILSLSQLLNLCNQYLTNFITTATTKGTSHSNLAKHSMACQVLHQYRKPLTSLLSSWE